MCDGTKCLKVLLIIFSCFYFVFGLGLMIAGAVVIGGMADFVDVMGKGFEISAIVGIVVGIFIMIVSVMGMIGTCVENVCLIYTYAWFILIFIICEAGIAIGGFVMRDSVDKNVVKGLQKMMDNYQKEKHSQDVMDEIQKKFKCCGAQMYTEWEKVFKEKKVPESCCIEKDCKTTYASTTEKHAFYTGGCFAGFGDFARRHILSVAIVAFVFGLLQILGLLVACCLKYNLDKQYHSVD